MFQEEEGEETVLRRLEESLNARPDDPSLHFDLVLLLLISFQYYTSFLQRALYVPLCANFNKLCEKKKKKGVLLWQKGGESEKEKAAEHFVISATLNSQNGAAFRYLGLYYAQVSADTQRALKCYKKAVSLNPDDSHSGVHDSILFRYSI